MIERLVPFLIDALVIFFVVRFFVRLLNGGGNVRRPSQGAQGPRVPERTGGTLVRDPECGTYVLQGHAVRLKIGAETLFFCSPACRDAYQRRT